ncbi:MAG: nucleotidyltransferase family protein [Thermoleophilaceae bacterium]
MSAHVERAGAPSELQLLFLRAALVEGPEAASAWEQVKHRTRNADVLDHASYRTLPQLYRNLAGLGVEDADMQRMKGIYRHAWCTNQRLFHDAARVLRALETAGIETMLLKGAAVSGLCYGSAGARPMADFDVLVHEADAPRAAAVLEEGGWCRLRSDASGEPSDEPLERTMRRTHSAGFRHSDGRECDLHWSPLYEPIPEAAFWKTAMPIVFGGVATNVPDPTHQLLHTCVHGLGWSAAPVTWIEDAVMIVRTAPGGIDWERVAEDAERWGLTGRVEPALRRLRDLFDIDVPPAVIARMAHARRTPSERLAERALAARGVRARPHVMFWARYRRLKRIGSPIADDGLTAYLRDSFGVPTRRAVLPHITRKAVGLVLRRAGARATPSGSASCSA